MYLEVVIITKTDNVNELFLHNVQLIIQQLANLLFLSCCWLTILTYNSCSVVPLNINNFNYKYLRDTTKKDLIHVFVK